MKKNVKMKINEKVCLKRQTCYVIPRYVFPAKCGATYFKQLVCKEALKLFSSFIPNMKECKITIISLFKRLSYTLSLDVVAFTCGVLILFIGNTFAAFLCLVNSCK